jgi:2'-5' RNA ligase
MRLFVAVPVPDEIRKRVAQLGTTIAYDGVNVVRPENMHLTLKFIGEVEDSKANEIKKSLDMVKLKPFEVIVRGVGVFPNEDYVRVVWTGVESNGELEKLATVVGQSVRYGGDNEKFSAHLTIARVKKKIDFQEFLGTNKQTEFGKFTVKKFELIQSMLGPSGPKYITLASFEGKK